MIQFRDVSDYLEFNSISKKLFKETYKEILSSDQIEYMNKMFFGIDEIKDNIKYGYIYNYIVYNEKIAGFIVYNKDNNYLNLSKLYLKSEFKGKNIASLTINYLASFNLDIRLTVNKNNAHAIHVYKKNGFNEYYEEVTDIGNNYVMDDYIMTKRV